MKYATYSLAFCLAWLSGAAIAFEDPPTDEAALQCYGHAMVGFDSVINSRLDVPVETSLAIVAPHAYAPIGGDGHSVRLLKVIFGAYLWEGNPHDYAVRVFFRCAGDGAQDTTTKQANAEPVP